MKKFTGLLFKESLKDNSFLDMIEITEEQVWNVDNTADYQPKVWTAIYFKGEGNKIDEMSEKLSHSLKSKWYANISIGNKEYVIFSKKVFKYSKKDKETKERAISYGKSLGIPDHQLDW